MTNQDRWKTSWMIILLLIGTMSTFSCGEKKELTYYEKLVKDELSSGIRNDSLFLGIYLGMNQKEFYTHCWQLNKEGKLIQGPTNLSAQWKIEEGVKSKTSVNFYPDFYKGKIMEMPVTFSYDSWAPWVKELSTDTLYQEVIKLMTEWYGEEFEPVPLENGNSVLVNIQGNRRIMISIKQENTVSVLYTDLQAKHEKLLAEKVLQNQ